MLLLLFVAEFIFLTWYSYNDKQKEIKRIEDRFTRRISYRGYCGRITYSSSTGLFTCTLVCKLIDSPGIGSAPSSVFLITASPEEIFSFEEDTEPAVLDMFYSHVDYILDGYQDTLTPYEEVMQIAQSNNISIEKALSHYSHTHFSKDISLKNQKSSNLRFRSDLHF